jgi:uncharacterized protein
MKPFSLLVKPVSGRCNIDCRYCFYKPVLDLYPTENSQHKMSLVTAEKLIHKYFSLKFPEVSICFQGGEPLLMGLDFYKKVVEFEKQYGFPGQKVQNTFQTNGLLIDEHWAKFFKEYNMLIGVSLDGDKATHDHDRVTASGKGTFDQVMSGIQILRQNNVDFNILSMLTASTIQQPENTYAFFREQEFNHLQFIPCVDQDPATGKPATHSITDSEFSEFYKKLFDLWYKDGYPDVTIRLFDDILAFYMDEMHTSCTFMGDCSSYLLVEHNGDIYPCDFFAQPDWKIGNITHDDFPTLISCPKRHDFSSMKGQLAGDCRKCDFLKLCNGDCTRLRLFGDRSPDSLSWLCPGFHDFLSYTKDRFKELAQDLKNRRTMQQPDVPQQTIPQNFPRNAPCPCGSGKKFKKCCGKLGL